MKKILVLMLVIFLISCTPQTSPETFCEHASDCVPAECCHATSAVNKEYAPDCDGVMCTLDCQEGTLDCGFGEIECIQNQCTVVFH